MRFYFTGPRFFGIRPGVSFDPRELAGRRQSSRGAMTGSFVYVVAGPGGHHKIGVSTDPIARLAQLQTGAHQALDFAYVGVTPGTGYNIEQAAHQMLTQYRQSGEWFAVPASIAIGAVIETAKRLGEPIQQVQPAMVPQIISVANQPAPTKRRSWVKWLFIVNVVLWSLVILALLKAI